MAVLSAPVAFVEDAEDVAVAIVAGGEVLEAGDDVRAESRGVAAFSWAGVRGDPEDAEVDVGVAHVRSHSWLWGGVSRKGEPCAWWKWN